MKAPAKKKSKFGRLSSLGVQELHQIALFLPEKHLDFRRIVSSFDSLQDHFSRCELLTLKAAQNDEDIEPAKLATGFIGQILSPPDVQFNGTPMSKFTLTLHDGYQVKFSLFRNAKETLENIENTLDDERNVLISGVPAVFGNTVWIKNVRVFEPHNAGRMIPIYKGKTKVIKPETAGKTVQKHLQESVPLSKDFILNKIGRDQVARFVDPEKLEMVLHAAHWPKSPAVASRANLILDQLAGLVAISKIKEHAQPDKLIGESARLNLTRWMNHTENLEFELTDEQFQIINEIAAAIDSGFPLRAMIQGDVGSGKTVVYALLAISCILDENKDVYVLLPNTTLATQIYTEISELLPNNEKGRAILVTGQKETTRITTSKHRSAEIRIGTTALLFRELKKTPGLVIIDEQQKYSNEQRNKLLTGTTHLLEVSATPIPRSVALVKYGALKVWRLTKNHTKKTIIPHLLIGRDECRQLMGAVKQTLNEGNQAIIVYALKSDSEADNYTDMVSAEQAFHKWERLYPGQVRLVHSAMDDEDKNRAVDDMKQGRASILIATTVIEVGVTIPKAMLLAIVNAERFGLTTQWQLRGRLARKGGVGNFYMLLPSDKNSPDTLDRLNIMLEASNGYEVAEKDLQLRGAGDLSKTSESQKGSDDSMLVGRKIDMRIIDDIIKPQSEID